MSFYPPARPLAQKGESLHSSFLESSRKWTILKNNAQWSDFVLSTFYLVFSLFACSFMLAIIFLVAWFTFAPKLYTLAWSISLFLSSSQWMLNLFFRDFFDDPSTRWIIVTSLQVAVVSISLWAHRSRVGLPTNPQLLLAIAVAVELLVYWFTVVDAHVGLRMSISVFYAAVVLIMISHALLGYRKKSLPAEIGAGTVYFILGTAQLVAAIAALMQGAQGNPHYLLIYRELNFLILPSAFIGMGLFTVFLLASDLAFEMRTLAMTDQLTGALNRRGFFEATSRAFSTAKRRKRSVSIILSDIDYFKKVNDSYGHLAGDITLTKFVEHLKEDIREEDVVARLGGEEFILLLPDTDISKANQVAERIRDRVEKHTVVNDDKQINITASFGVIGINADEYIDMESIETAINMADRALYKAKERGRNVVVSIASENDGNPVFEILKNFSGDEPADLPDTT